MRKGSHHSKKTRSALRKMFLGKRTGPRKDLTGRVFGRLTVVKFYKSVNSESLWECVCICGKIAYAGTRNLNSKNTRSCGCLWRGSVYRTHGMTGTSAYGMLCSAKSRSKRQGLPFNLKVKDIFIPDFCPVLGIPLFPGNKTVADNSPTLDKINPTKGYILGNIKVISNRANRIKQDATIDELEKVIEYIKRETSL